MFAWAQEDIAAQYAGRPVAEILEAFRADGINFAYSTNLVPADLLVESEPEPGAPLEIALQILQPHGLTIHAEANVYLVIRAGQDSPDPGASAVAVDPAQAQPALESIAVTASRYEILRDISTSRFDMDQRTIQNLRLDGDIESGRRFVSDHEARPRLRGRSSRAGACLPTAGVRSP
jgi:5-enolpyruvylshikimate-3-phosphate synthase